MSSVYLPNECYVILDLMQFLGSHLCFQCVAFVSVVICHLFLSVILFTLHVRAHGTKEPLNKRKTRFALEGFIYFSFFLCFFAIIKSNNIKKESLPPPQETRSFGGKNMAPELKGSCGGNAAVVPRRFLVRHRSSSSWNKLHCGSFVG